MCVVLLLTHPRSGFGALLDWRGADSGKAGPTRVDQLMPVLTTPRIGWVAGITQKQLEQAWVRRLVHQYCQDYVTLPCARSPLGVVLGQAAAMDAITPDALTFHHTHAGGAAPIDTTATLHARQPMFPTESRKQ